VSTPVNSTWYAVKDNTGKSYATSVYTNSTSNFTLPTANFNTPGTYNLLVSADKLTGCAASTASATVVVNAAVTPVRFISVAAARAGGGIAINWTVAEETDVNHYDIEKSFDGVNFDVIGSVKYKEVTTLVNKYNFTDVAGSNTDKVYYRIRQVDHNLFYTLSSIVMVKMAPDKILQIWPNPATDQVTVNITVNNSQATYIEMLDLTGSKLLTKQVNLVAGANSVLIKNLNSFSPGVYLFKIVADGETTMQKIVIK
jgi:hypothetical protein